MTISTKPSQGTQYLEAGSQAHTADLILAQDRARLNVGTVTQNWAPWLIGGLVIGGVAYLVLKD